jgi:hypothetical protein
MNKPINEQLDDLVLRAIRTGTSMEDLFQMLMSKAQLLSQSGPIVQAVIDARATRGGRDL